MYLSHQVFRQSLTAFLTGFSEPVLTVAFDFCSWLTGVDPDEHVCLIIS